MRPLLNIGVIRIMDSRTQTDEIVLDQVIMDINHALTEIVLIKLDLRSGSKLIVTD